jgi:hypothetical protein
MDSIGWAGTMAVGEGSWIEMDSSGHSWRWRLYDQTLPFNSRGDEAVRWLPEQCFWTDYGAWQKFSGAGVGPPGSESGGRHCGLQAQAI